MAIQSGPADWSSSGFKEISAVSKPIPTINRYKADLREFAFLLFEQFHVDQMLGKEPFDAWDVDQCKATLQGAYRWVREVTGPLNALGDVTGCKIVDGKLVTPPGFKEAWK